MTEAISHRRLLLGIATLGIVGMLAGGATVAFYGDVEESTGNTFTTGGVDLEIGSTATYNNMVCTEIATSTPGYTNQYTWQAEPGFTPTADHYPAVGSPCVGTWELTDLEDGVHTFFSFGDIKPGDMGTQSLAFKVQDNPSWARCSAVATADSDGTCTESEQDAESGACVPTTGDGELDDYLTFDAWVDQGAIPGFQCSDASATSTGAGCDADPTEGDGEYQATELYAFQDELFVASGTLDFAPALAALYAASGCSVADGETNHGACHGLRADGAIVPGVEYFTEVTWELPLLAAGNDVQTDLIEATFTCEVEQHRHNPTPFGGSNPVVPPVTATATITVNPQLLTGTTDDQMNFIASVIPGAGFSSTSTVVLASDAGNGGFFFKGTVTGDCTETVPDADNEFPILNNTGICYANTTPGTYSVTTTLLDESGGTTLATSETITVVVTTASPGSTN